LVRGEVEQTRPAVILSNDTAKRPSTGYTWCISNQVSRLSPAEACISVAGERHKAMANQITTTCKQRLKRRLDKVSKDEAAARWSASLSASSVQPGLSANTLQDCTLPPSPTVATSHPALASIRPKLGVA
jgi:mRNA-degrading endonuclease toxin of MazEF toxin-antitoxin module